MGGGIVPTIDYTNYNTLMYLKSVKYFIMRY
ncbi:hypothetical protein elemo79C_phanotate53 [Flavobacterium phage vB_FspP_elemoA_7-9C]|nr:hypothetical protein elemo19A_phanotate53 [Flavobacterium phage vB_FspP_elemoA_1-9A]QMP86288.1 hypothetical protein elemo119C_phanotate54 [Flavobacterium phage vB_FspP_elemoA_11-9C]QMP87184.1 hypothetical protein elemo143D_phanotate52 [Flavobacterium phage vB_FspP_elemoA_14-3D]QMP87644.1 hypothetical protein elemo159A_phanotate66 [Flavobacterium phage vB_FspP_elemoC_15-9A]QMP88205.1 hypothetical protein elemo35A_phanotate1 [Flavobacterium phage vB_FspP_elemoA_3-5A]QMP89420.1 hypothetical pr